MEKYIIQVKVMLFSIWGIVNGAVGIQETVKCFEKYTCWPSNCLSVVKIDVDCLDVDFVYAELKSKYPVQRFSNEQTQVPKYFTHPNLAPN